jgi:hypothetical protein
MSEWKSGFVHTIMADGPHGYRRLEAGQNCVFESAQMKFLKLTVVSTSECGEVVLRPHDLAEADSIFPEREQTFKGQTALSREPCPFTWVTERQAKGSSGKYQAGDLLCHEAWGVWEHIVIL